MCVKAHEKAVIAGGVTEDQVNDTIRIAATFHAVHYYRLIGEKTPK